GLSARRFAEYLSLAQVPDPDAPADADRAFAPPADDLLPTLDAAPLPAEPADATLRDPLSATVIAGTLRAPWRWERLLVEAAVIGGKDRWERRLAGLQHELALRRNELRDEEEARVAACERAMRDLAHLRDFALPLLTRLEALPQEADWAAWLGHL